MVAWAITGVLVWETLLGPKFAAHVMHKHNQRFSRVVFANTVLVFIWPFILVVAAFALITRWFAPRK